VTIERLDQVVADAIAAGEVVERPASVVKELVENALDAGAGNVTVELDGAGQDRIVVTDDGAGIAATELPLALTRHATSKLRTVADLSAVRSLGFRGEALASIAAVSRLECRSATGEGEGAVLSAEHGVVGEVAVAAAVPGTRVEVLGLFENTPARRAFLKRPATEVAATVRVLSALALCHPDVRFRLLVDGRRTLDLPITADVGGRLRSLQRGLESPLPVQGAREAVTVTGVLGQPAASRRTREHLYLSVNGRPVASRGLAFAVEQSYRGLVEPGRFPVGALALAVPAETVDVNVHPTKREVRFRDERSIFGLLQESCLAALSESGVYSGSALFGRAPDRGTFALREGAPSGYGGAAMVAQATRDVEQLDIAAVEPTGSGPLLRGPFHLVGQVLDSYIVAEGPDGLVLVDQHAAHERILYNQLVAGRAAGRGPSLQPMLVPALLRLSPLQAACLQEVRGDLAAAGMVVEDFGGGSARLLAHDPRLPARGLDRIAVDVLDTLIAETRETDMARRLERTTYTVACHAAVKFGQRLSREEMEGLLRNLEVADPGITCPHGRPTMLEIGAAQLRREFRRS
jgi:DNA mismatch repair protein MutL